MTDTETIRVEQRHKRWYLVRENGDLVKWGHGSSWAANFRLRRDALAWAADEGLEVTR